MRSWLRKLRGTVGTALTWAGAWALGSVALSVFIYTVGPGLDGRPFMEVAPLMFWRAGLWGFLSGTLFSGALAVFHRHRTLDELKTGKMALWGAVSGLLVPATVVGVAAARGQIPLTIDVVGSMLFIFGGLGVATAAGTVRLARGPSPAWTPKHVAPGECPRCGHPVPQGASTCENYPNGRLRRECGFDLTLDERLLGDGGLPDTLFVGVPLESDAVPWVRRGVESSTL